jgi:hypothetical protein
MEHIKGQGGVEKFLNDPNKVKAELARIIVESTRTWRDLYGEIPLPFAVTPSEKQAVKTPEADSIEKAVAEYKSQPLTPELVDKTWQTLWTEWGKRIGETFVVPSCDRAAEELAQLQEENKAVLLIPDGVDLIMLGKMFPRMKSWTVSERTTIIESGKGGIIDIEMDSESPHRDTTEA